MANNIPASLRTADIGRFALRAAQIEKAKPVVAYWCEWIVYVPPRWEPRTDRIANAIGNFHIVNQIIERGLHNSDDEVKLYTTDLVEKLEQVRCAIPRLPSAVVGVGN